MYISQHYFQISLAYCGIKMSLLASSFETIETLGAMTIQVVTRAESRQLNSLKGEFTFFLFELNVPPLGESNLMGPKKSVKVKFSL